MLLLQALKPFNSFLPFPTFYSQSLNSAISPKGRSRCSFPRQPLCKVKKVNELINFLIHWEQKISNYLLAPFISLKAQHTSNSLHRSFQDSGFVSPMYIQMMCLFLQVTCNLATPKKLLLKKETSTLTFIQK